jgi:CheY-like chemotaxis protein
MSTFSRTMSADSTSLMGQTNAPGPRATVLIVEDDPELAETIADVVRDRRCRALCAHNGLEALDILERERPALILIDLFMPIMNGAELLKVMRQSPRLAQIPRVIMTGANDPMIGVKQDVSVFYKPLDLTALARLIQRHSAGGTAATPQWAAPFLPV